MVDLDAPEQFGELDPKGMLRRISELPQQCEDAWHEIQQLELPAQHREIDQVLVVGLGGSGIGADLLTALLAPECSVPIIAHRDYELPAFVDHRTLVIANSHSGGTEETLAGFDVALQRSARVVSVTTGGELARRTRDKGLPLYEYGYKTQPRAALGYSLIALLGIMENLGFASDKSEDVAEAVDVMRGWQAEVTETVATENNAAKGLAASMQGCVPVVYGAEHLGPVACRWKGQFNENAKSWSEFDLLPELNHNTVVGYGLPRDMIPLAYVIMLTSALSHPRVRLRFEITRELLERGGFAVATVEARGRSLLAQMLSTIHFGDYVSYYLALLNGVDPWGVGNIQFVKDQLSEHTG